MKTLGNLHSLPSSQISFREFLCPLEMKLLHTYHSDMREIPAAYYKDLILLSFMSDQEIFKQHIPPTNNNINLLRNVHKVILLRDPDQIIGAYYRAEKKEIHSARKEFQHCQTLEDWKKTAHHNGLHSDLNWFYNEWMKEANKNPRFNLLIKYSDLILSPKKTVNQVEQYFNLPISDEVTLLKKRYSRFFIQTLSISQIGTLIINKIKTQVKKI
jgi:hypothetical protein